MSCDAHVIDTTILNRRLYIIIVYLHIKLYYPIIIGNRHFLLVLNKTAFLIIILAHTKKLTDGLVCL